MALSINQIVADLEYCREIKKLGVKIDTYFYWSGYLDVDHNEDRDMIPTYYTEQLSVDAVPAPTASELFEMLPHKINERFYLQIDKKDSYVGLVYKDIYEDEYLFEIQAGKNKLANCICKTIIYLLKNNIISLDEVNKNI